MSWFGVSLLCWSSLLTRHHLPLGDNNCEEEAVAILHGCWALKVVTSYVASSIAVHRCGISCFSGAAAAGIGLSLGVCARRSYCWLSCCGLRRKRQLQIVCTAIPVPVRHRQHNMRVEYGQISFCVVSWCGPGHLVRSIVSEAAFATSAVLPLLQLRGYAEMPSCLLLLQVAASPCWSLQAS